MINLRILHVDDDADIRTIVGMSLSLDRSLECSIATSGEEGLAMIASGFRPDVIVLDVMMPRLDGLQMLDRMRADPATADIPVIFMTATGRQADVDSYTARDAAGVILKPFDPLHLATEIRALLSSHQRKNFNG